MDENEMNIRKLEISAWLDRLQPSEGVILLTTAIAVGMGTGLGAVLFIRMIAWTQNVFFVSSASFFNVSNGWIFILAPAIGGLLAGPIIAYFAKEAKGHGVPEVMQALVLRGGRIRPRVVVAKVIASALCIGSGGSAGREGPIVQVGSALGSTIGQWLQLSEARIRNLVACGAAAGIAATFNAPIAGVVFAMEIILGELHLGDLGNVVISAVTASTVARIFLGDRPAFTIPNYTMRTPWEILLYVILGVLAAFIAVGFIRLLYGFEDLFDNWRFPDALKPAIGGLLLGGLAVIYPWILHSSQANASTGTLPEIFGAGFGTIEGALQGKLSLALLFVLVFLKPLATSFTLGSGNSGGVFAPGLFTGAALGGAFGWVVEYFMPGATAGPGAFAIVGMAAVFAGAAHAPFTAILIVFEMTNDYRLILPLMAAVIISLIVSQRLLPESIYTLKLARRGIHLQSGRDLDVMETVTVSEVMVTKPVTVPVDLPVTKLADEFLRTGRHGFPVINQDGSLFGVVSLEDYRRATNSGPAAADPLLVKDIATRDVVSVYPDENVGTALRRMAPRDISRLPVVSRKNAHQLVGVVRRNDIVRAYDVGALRREEARQRVDQLRAVSDARTRFMEVPLTTDSHATGHNVATLGLPLSAVVVSIRRGRDLLLPHGNTLLLAGDVITLLCEKEHVEEVESILLKGGAPSSPTDSAPKS
jgi:CIC family chloride channel protein